ncbi:MAG: flavodoxin domain-containing protein [Anaerolineae bacterium]|nr:flavodoxin domain-containing protein [Anaerolineae bacterium]
MKAIVVYDSTYGNTEKIAQAIGQAIAAEVHRVGQVSPSDLKAFDLVIVGSPTMGGRPTEAIQALLKATGSAWQGISAAAFDTRLTARWVRIFNYAAPRIAGSLKGMGATLLGSPEGFFVLGTKGPLKEGEIGRAACWAKEIVMSKTW